MNAGTRELRGPERVRTLPWKNGRGATEEIFIEPAGADFAAGDFQWRLSKAAVDAPGPFSMFPGFERVLVPWSGGGLLLTHDDDPPTFVAPFTAARFAGERKTLGVPRAEDEGPPDAPAFVRDANLFLRRGVVAGDLRVTPLRAPTPIAAAGAVVVLHAAVGEITWRDDDAPSAERVVLVPGATLLVRDAARLRGSAAPAAAKRASDVPAVLLVAEVSFLDVG